MRTNTAYKEAALEALKGNWKQAVLAVLVLFVIAALAGGLPLTGSSFLAFGGNLLVILIVVPLEFTMLNAFRSLLNTGDNRILDNMFSEASNNYGRVLLGSVLMSVFIFLWTLLLIVPGIIKSFAYALTPYLLKDCPELSPNQCIDLSQEMMKGHKTDLFILWLSFIGWALLSMITFGIGFIFLIPYMYTAMAGFYEDVKAEYEAKRQAAA